MKEEASVKSASITTVGALPAKHFSRYREPAIELPELIEGQIASYEWLVKEGIREVFQEFATIKDFSEKKFILEFVDFKLEAPKTDALRAVQTCGNYDAPMKATVRLTNRVINSVKEQELFLSDFPVMTEQGTFIVNGIERVIVPQLARSYGVLFTENFVRGKGYYGAKVIPARGAWIEFETDGEDVVMMRIDKSRKFPVTTWLRVLGAPTDDDIRALFKKADERVREAIEKTLKKDQVKTAEEAYVDIYRRLRDGDLATFENAKAFVDSIMSDERFDLSRVGRYKFNSRFGLAVEGKALDQKLLSKDDFAIIVGHAVSLNHTPGATPDDVDHLGSRRVRFIGELLQQKIRTGMVQIKRNVQNRMSTIDSDASMPVAFISARPLQARIKEFFTTNQLSQFLQQDNVLTELEHLRTISALGPGGLSRERAGLEVRDVHPSHYGRVCPIQTPEGPNIGLILRFSQYAKTNEFGMIETPYCKVKNGKVTKEIVYLNAHEEEKWKIAHAAAALGKDGTLTEELVDVRYQGGPARIPPSEVHYADVAPTQAFSIATAMIPFLNHDEANRALMASNMQKQAVPTIRPDAPVVGTGAEKHAMKNSKRLAIADFDGTVAEVDARQIVLKGAKETKTYRLANFVRTNSFTCYHQRPIVNVGDKVKKGDVLADTSSSDHGQIALGQNCLVAFLSWSGSNYEDAIILSQKLSKEQTFTSIHMEEVVVNVRDTKLGPEVTTPDIPNVSEAKLRNLDEEGIVRIGAEVRPGDILVGKITPKGETQLTPEERLLRSIFGDKARDVKDTSKRVDGGKRGRVIGIKIFSREKGDRLESGIIKRVHVEIAELRGCQAGDKLAGRHGNKGVISKILPEEDMPFMKDGTPVDVILTPLGVPSRMNLGQILEMHLGLAAMSLGYQAIAPAFTAPSDEDVKAELVKAGFPSSGKIPLFDGRTGEKFAQDIAVGYMYLLKLHHMVEDKIHMRAIGPYSLITQQPLGGKAQNGGQRFGEMEVWALLGYGAAYTLREMLTYKSDDIQGRSAAFDAIVKGEPIRQSNVPAAFNVLLATIRGLGIQIDLKEPEGLEERN